MKKMRGYITSREFKSRVPQHLQNLVIRDYCSIMNFQYLLSVTEHIMPQCTMILEQLVDDLSGCDGIAMYSVFQLPDVSAKREFILKKIVTLDKSVHFALEKLSVANNNDINEIEELLKIAKVVDLQTKGEPYGAFPDLR